MLMMQHVNIPAERVAVLIGTKGETKRGIEKRTKTKITVGETTVTIEGEPFDEWITKDIVMAISRGFSPERAQSLLRDDFSFELIYLPDITGDSEKAMKRMRARVIGTKGKARIYMETLTDTSISVYGKTIGILGLSEDVHDAKEAILKILTGSSHAAVYNFLERLKSKKIGVL